VFYTDKFATILDYYGNILACHTLKYTSSIPEVVDRAKFLKMYLF